jgi:hypothetical protein
LMPQTTVDTRGRPGRHSDKHLRAFASDAGRD